jgi:hypothetical protein
VEALSYDAADALAVALAEPVPPTREDRRRLVGVVLFVSFALAVGLAFGWWLTVLTWAGATLVIANSRRST